MASNHYRVNGVLYKRSTKQGRPLGSGIGKKSVPVSMTEDEKKKIQLKAKELDMNFSQYIVMAAVLFDVNIFVKDIA